MDSRCCAEVSSEGQDVASVGESSCVQFILAPATQEEIESQGHLTEAASATQKLIELDLQNRSDSVRERDSSHSYGGVYACMILPSLVLGTVGGGTALATQKECLEMMGCYGKGGVSRLAEMIAGFALGLDLSTMAAVASGQFATAHEKLGRNHPTHGLKDEYLNREFFEKVLGPLGEVLSWSKFNVHTGNSILSELTKAEMSKKVGHFGYVLTYKNAEGSLQTQQVVLKSKPTDIETSNMINKMAQGCGLNLAMHHERHKMETGFRYCHTREVILAQLENPELKAFMPETYHTLFMPAKDVYVIVMEYLTSEHYSLLNTADDISDWTMADIKVVLRDVAKIHSLFLDKQDWLKEQSWLEQTTGEKMDTMEPLWRALLKHAHSEFPEFWTDDRVVVMEGAIDSIPQIWSTLDSAPHTMIHNDCNPRNICLRRVPTASDPPDTSNATPYPDPRTMQMYDWELATISVPQRDLAEFLAFTLPPSASVDTWLELIGFYRHHLQYYSDTEFPANRFLEVFDFACLDFAMNRLLLYTMAHTYKDYQFLPRVVNSLFTYLSDRVARGSLKLKSHRSKL